MDRYSRKLAIEVRLIFLLTRQPLVSSYIISTQMRCRKVIIQDMKKTVNDTDRAKERFMISNWRVWRFVSRPARWDRLPGTADWYSSIMTTAAREHIIFAYIVVWFFVITDVAVPAKFVLLSNTPHTKMQRNYGCLKLWSKCKLECHFVCAWHIYHLQREII